jgi:hypothetical protein
MDFSACKEIWRFFSQYSLNGATSINKVKVTQPLVFPNPSNSSFYINLTEFGKSNVQVYNQLGQIVIENKNVFGIISFELPVDGAYYLVLNGDKTSAQKIIKLP